MTRRTADRAAFTLVELLVVIAIIGVLVSLTLPAVQKIRGTGPRLQAKNDITQLDEACTTFKNKFGFYPPTQFRIPATIQSNPAHADYPGTVLFQRMFPRWMRGAADNTSTGLTATPLVGNASMVYFLAGPAGTGWAVDAPVAPSATAVGKYPPYAFEVKRLVGAMPGTVFNDPWGTPYAYHGSVTGGTYPNVGVPGPGTVSGVFPFNRGPGRWVNPGGVQIISAGENKLFGQGGTWAPTTGQYVTGQNGGDDIANFNEGKLLGVQ